MGWLRFLEGGRKFDCINSPSTAHPIPVHVEEVKDIVSVAEYILLVEKESGETLIFRWGDKEFLSSHFFYLDEIFSCNVGAAVFQRLANDHFCNSNRCIVITRRGYPDIPTRRFLRLLVEKLSLPVYCLVDCDPYGFDILATHRFGSMVRLHD